MCPNDAPEIKVIFICSSLALLANSFKITLLSPPFVKPLVPTTILSSISSDAADAVLILFSKCLGILLMLSIVYQNNKLLLIFLIQV